MIFQNASKHLPRLNQSQEIMRSDLKRFSTQRVKSVLCECAGQYSWEDFRGRAGLWNQSCFMGGFSGKIAATWASHKSRQVTAGTTLTPTEIIPEFCLGAPRHQGSLFSLLISLRHTEHRWTGDHVIYICVLIWLFYIQSNQHNNFILFSFRYISWFLYFMRPALRFSITYSVQNIFNCLEFQLYCPLWM